MQPIAQSQNAAFAAEIADSIEKNFDPKWKWITLSPC